MTIQELKDLKIKVTNPQALEAIDIAIKYKQIVPSLELMKKIKIKKVADKLFKTNATKKKLDVEIELLDQLIRHLGD